ncbi:iron-siderophore ABC transporter substrate-binding protein [Microlunatus elymi]|uniref:Iron-siderophore ABC transporter substrate-binding protein n=1 Tax=Microlunatus elymi TaxID=2596828 RepID=A0A516Q5Y0_9ACTN|nr:iron-siderophore ABC transporter substrate-binding protein [Microlunatus elymi]
MALVSVLGLIVLAACQSSATPQAGQSAGSGGSSAFPVTIQHAFGATTIEKKPTRVVTWGFGSTDAALALGVVPVAIPQQTYGADKEGLLPWIKQKLTQLNAKTPAILPNPSGSDDVPFEEITRARPDLILANYSGITKQQYETLSKIAPTVAYPDKPWATPWRDVVTTVGEALGQSAEAEKLVADTDRTIKDKAAAYPQLKGKTVAAVWDVGGTFYVYKDSDPRVQFLTDLGLVNAPSVDRLAPDDENFYYTLSYEKTSSLTSDVLVVYADDQKGIDTFLSKPYAKSMQQVKAGHVAPVVGPAFVAAVSPPTVLSLPWGIDGYLKALSKSVNG